LVKDKKRAAYLSNGSSENGSINQGILELISQFGYVSFEEVMYGFGLLEKESRNHLEYMVQLGLIQTFPSHAQPRYFYCMDKAGFSEVRSKDIAREVDYFNKNTYRPFSQNHDRMLVRIHCALKKLFGPDLESWVSEKKIRRDVCFKSIFPTFRFLAGKESKFLEFFGSRQRRPGPNRSESFWLKAEAVIESSKSTTLNICFKGDKMGYDQP